MGQVQDRWLRRLAVALGALAVLTSSAVAGEGDEDCLKCHANPEALAKALTDPARPIEDLLVDKARYERSVHASRGCAECHDGFDKQPHSKRAETIACSDCHDAEAEKLAESVHGKATEGDDRLPATCGSCHGVHDVLKPDDPESRLFPLNVHNACGKCHFSKPPETLDRKGLLEQKYLGDQHGHGIVVAGLYVTATCVSCHGGHGVQPVDSPESRVARYKVDLVCGKCHVGALEEYRQSIHFLKSEGEEHKGATCTDCHTPHHIRRADATFHMESVKACTKCHHQRAASYSQSYHGKVVRLGTSVGYGGREVATCNACHNNHAILPESDPKSSIHDTNIVATCGKCHEGAHKEFASYLVHADPRDGERYPRVHLVYVVMNSLLIGVLILGGIHAVMWLIRSSAAGEWKRPRHAPGERHIRRWPRNYVTYHVWMMTSVLILASTGLPLHYSDKRWASDIMHFLGGPEVAGTIHRYSAILLCLLFIAFLTDLVWRRLVRREKDIFSPENTMLPRLKDVQDFWGNLKWFLFLAPRPRYDRWTYWEKFDFWAAFWGLFVIGLSGLMLWFPVHATRLVPGWFLNAAVVVHGIEALLDIAFIFTVHVFHANLRPDKFPMDTMFWTGRMPESEFRHDRPLEYDRHLAQGTMEGLYDRTPVQRTRIVAYLIGTCALLVGFFFVAAMIVAVIQGP